MKEKKEKAAAAVAEIKTKAKTKTNSPKFDYEGEEFLSYIEEMARQGHCDAYIAYSLKDKFDNKNLAPQYFSKLKNEKGKDGKRSKRGQLISEALSRGRVNINAMVRATYLQTALGQKTVKSTTRQRIRTKDGEMTDDELISTTEQEIAPNMQALAAWLFNHDDEWRENILAHRREEADAVSAEPETGPTEVNVAITYNQKSDIELQQKLSEPSQK